MAERTRAATYGDVVRVAERLEKEGAEYAFIGGYALRSDERSLRQ